MLDAVVDYLPSPLTYRPVTGITRRRTARSARTVDDGQPFSALAFKLPTDPFVGKLTFFRVYSGTLKAGSYVFNSAKVRRSASGRILRHSGDHREEIEQVFAGEIAAAVGLKDTFTGDTMSDPYYPVDWKSITFPEPVIEAHRAEDEGRPGQDGRRAPALWPTRIRPSGLRPMPRLARLLFRAWANSISKCSSTV